MSQPTAQDGSPDVSPSGETDLDTLLEQATPILADEVYVFCRGIVLEQAMGHPDVWAWIREAEATTVIASRAAADRAGWSYRGCWRRITLAVHSSLEAVGFLAQLLPPLARAGIAVNVISAYHHDHLFVPAQRAREALALLKRR
ncbi:MAG: ACT domain-containing protein [Candidatus Competibacterales bacterium]